ncbi:MFS transporter, FHS family, L-fucose permease [Saccharicrinis carchari]|uniref:MFS transporter, FHS family, L-fucose permease n=1 Tax=Saccharicrinis carchari TaxID=1168039 RepID=A0A521DDN8_SACCC|nr:L-fucose:H+ symporter permease [Saccharicrinis carchari]SMO69763.1 MFS transporter, FHS family, L-fucose permease [Saccharicrinis carchari]
MNKSSKVVEKKYLVPFVLITSLFALWGFANDITNPMVAAFKTVMEISNAEASLVQFAFYGGYATMAIPAALFVQRFSYKKGILMGLVLYAIGALLFWPAAQYEAFGFFLVSLYVLTFGLAFLETTANPYILSMGSLETSTRRLNLAQAFNPMGSLLGMFVASRVVLAALASDKQRNAAGELIFSSLDEATKVAIKTHDLMVIRNPYVILGLVVIIMIVVIAMAKMPKTGHATHIHPMQSFKRLIKNKNYRGGVVAQVFYVAAQIMCWTFIIQYAENLGISKATAQMYNIVAMGIFLASRFISTFLMKYVNSRKLLMWFAMGGMLTISGTILIEGMLGLYCLVATSAFMSLMFPTIYGVALKGVGQDATLGAAGLVMAIVGGALMPPLQGAIIDLGTVGFLPAVNFSFVLPFICFIVIAIYGYRSYQAQIVS